MPSRAESPRVARYSWARACLRCSMARSQKPGRRVRGSVCVDSLGVFIMNSLDCGYMSYDNECTITYMVSESQHHEAIHQIEHALVAMRAGRDGPRRGGMHGPGHEGHRPPWGDGPPPWGDGPPPWA